MSEEQDLNEQYQQETGVIDVNVKRTDYADNVLLMLNQIGLIDTLQYDVLCKLFFFCCK